ncbi:MAG: ATP-binding cassette domain-containing protein, partial [Chloroflexi bacterium]
MAEGTADGFEARGVGKRYGRRRRWALKDVDVAVPRGSITALVGPNGAGKSTLIKAASGHPPPSSCDVHQGSCDGPPEGEGMAEGTADGFEARGVGKRYGRRRRLDQLAIPLTSRADELSGGQQAQVGLALALGTRAPVLLLDEPLASLDPLARREFLHVLVDAVRVDGSTALLSSHVITDIEQACDRLLVLGGGRKLLDLSIAESIAAHRIVETRAPGD